MDAEIEVKFLNVDFDDVRQRLSELGAVCEKPMRLMRRLVFDNDFMKEKNGWIRVRDEGDKVTLTYKQTDSFDIDGTREIEAIVDSFDNTVVIFKQLGMNGGSFQESKRESWRLGEVEIDLDEWPWLNPYVEIEGKDAEAVRELAGKLGFDMKDAVSGDVMVAYRAQYSHLGLHDTVASLPEVKFGDPLPEMLK